MAKRKANRGKGKKPVGRKVKRRQRLPRVLGQPSSRSSLRCRGFSGDSPEVCIPSGMTMVRFPPKVYTRPICRMYGLDREWEYKGYFFCSECKLADEAVYQKGMHRANASPTSRRFSCQAHHTCYAYPTDRGKMHNCFGVKIDDEKSSHLLIQRTASNSNASNSETRLSRDRDRESKNSKIISKLKLALSQKEAEVAQRSTELISVKVDLVNTRMKLSSRNDQISVLAEKNECLHSTLHDLQSAFNKLRNLLTLSNQQARRDREKSDRLEGMSNPESLMETVCDL